MDSPSARPRSEWSNGICQCSCCDCLLACLCPCTYYAENVAKRLALTDPDSDYSTTACITLGCVYCALWAVTGNCVPTLMQCYNRNQTRESYRIRGDCCEDLLCACCCQPCAMVQEGRELEHRPAALTAEYTPIICNTMRSVRT